MLYDLVVTKRYESKLKLKDLERKVIVFIKTATGCSFTPQYKVLEELEDPYVMEDAIKKELCV